MPSGLSGPERRRRHQVLAFRSVLAAHILKDADIPCARQRLVAAHRQAVEHIRRLRVREARRGVVRRARQQDRRAVVAPSGSRYGVKLHSVAHRDHLLALDVVAFLNGRLEIRRHIVCGHLLFCCAAPVAKATQNRAARVAAMQIGLRLASLSACGLAGAVVRRAIPAGGSRTRSRRINYAKTSISPSP